jgi:parallel beta-helix repeat protein
VKGSSNIKIYDDAFQQDSVAINLTQSSTGTTIYANTISQNNIGIALTNSNGNTIYHNNFIGNTQQVSISGSSGNVWDDGYPGGGNYWSDYTGVDLKSGPNQNQPGSDGIGDTPYTKGGITDRYPLMNPWPCQITPPSQITQPSPPVGGIWIPVNKFTLLAPYIALASTIILAIAVTAVFVEYKKKRQVLT